MNGGHSKQRKDSWAQQGDKNWEAAMSALRLVG